jgi:hypothetical protein
MQISKYIPYRILTKSVEKFVGYLKISSSDLTQTRLYYESIWLKIGTAPPLSVNVSHMEI